MKDNNKILFSLVFSLIFGSSLSVLQIDASSNLPPSWTYVASELETFDLYGDMSQWIDVTPANISLKNLDDTEESLSLSAHFGYNSSHLFVGISIPNQGVTVYGIEIIFIIKGGYDGIVVDSMTQEGRDVTYVNTTYVAFDSDLGGSELIEVNVEDYGEEELYMITDDVRYPSGDLESDWDFDDGDSVAVVFQAWVNETKDDTNRPNYSTTADSFNYLRLSIGHDGGQPLELHSLFPSSFGMISDKEVVSKKVSELDCTLDGKKDEDFWETAFILLLEIVLVNKYAITPPQVHSVPDDLNISLSSIYDDDDLLVHIDVHKENTISKMEELILILGEDGDSFYNLTSEHLVCKITPTTSHIFSALTTELMTAGIVTGSDPTGLIFFDVPNWADASGHFDLYEVESGHIVESVDRSSVEFIIPIVKNHPDDRLGLFMFNHPSELTIEGLTIRVNESEPSDPYPNPWSEVILEEDQLKIIMHKLNFSTEISTPTRTISLFSISVFTLIPIVWVLTIRKRKLKSELDIRKTLNN
jgi:hypothetical protein